jgi:hypothetical protein
MKIVINRCFGGFGLSEPAMHAYAARKGLTLYPEKDGMCTTYWKVPADQRPAEIDWSAASLEERRAHNEAYSSAVLYDRDIARDDPDLVAVVESLGSEQSSDRYANLHVVEVPDGIEWEIDEYDGSERIAEKHRTWG